MRYCVVLLFALLSVGFVYPTATEPGVSGGPASFVAPEGKALVVFVRPSKLGKAVNFYVVDEDKKLVTLFKGNQHVAITAPPGKHTFYVVSENAGLVRAELAAGRTYIISTRAKMGFGKARVIVEPVLRNSPSFAESAKWVRDTKPVDPDLGKGDKWVRKHQDAIDKRIGKAEGEWSSGDAKYRAALTMEVEDGRTQDEAGAL
ncbi:MAG: hypothetical protein JRE45_10765 [Deltaproteobacteria bacterium]|nr:hypothetical protein [Deltaproteobacteria bacterium]MBW1875692.1 hypothetical protein [Deltaproteobacteria bacterium]MBW2552087.1 hypothetical protein [Deltaproteobacteria bacterium]MBW2628093.1 hypothetical protein [Deltaproteobacteria bacterium]MBW2686620.1 hypothetical protein [Deltaproteobacteria bacterium]